MVPDPIMLLACKISLRYYRLIPKKVIKAFFIVIYTLMLI